MRIAKSIFFAVLLWLIMPLAVNIAQFAIRGALFPALCQWFPKVFTDFSPVTQTSEYYILEAVLDISVATVTIFLFSYVTVRYDNERMEHMIKRTDGMYTLKEGIIIYYPRYILTEILVSAALSVPFVVSSAIVPKHIHDLVDPIFDYLFSFTEMITSHLGFILGGAVIFLTVLILRLLSGLRSLRAWQGIWLSEIE